MEKYPATSVTILIVTRNRAEDLKKTIMAIDTLDVPTHCSVELLIGDNGSNDGTAELVRKVELCNMPVRYISEPKPGKSRTLNTAIDNVTSDIIIFTDDDVRPPHDWIGRICAPIIEGRADMVAGAVHLASHLERPFLVGMTRALVGAATDGLDPQDPLLALGANCAVARYVFDKIPAYDTEIGPGTVIGFFDDFLFSQQVKAAGFRLVSAFDVSVEHHFPAERLTYDAIKRRAMAEGRSLAYFDYHWRHLSLTHPHLRFLRRALGLAYWRLRHPRRDRSPSAEGMSLEELHLLINCAYAQQLYIEQKRSWLYEREGLVKIVAAE